MKVLFISSDNNSTSGAFRSMVKLNALLHDNFDVETKVVLPKLGDGEKLLKDAAIPYTYVKSFSWIVKMNRKNPHDWGHYILKVLLQPYNLTAIRRIRRIIESENYDIVHLNTTFPYVGALACKKTKAKLVWHLREFLEEDRSQKILNRNYGYRLIEKADKIVAISNTIFEKYNELLNTENLVRIYNGIDVAQFYYSRSIFQEDVVQLLIVGVVSPEKGQKDVIEACAELKKKNIAFHLNVVGKLYDKKYLDEINEIIRINKMEGDISIVGIRSDVQDFQKKSDIAFVCSKSEAFGRVTVEAMLAGCLVIGADTAGTAEILENGKYGLTYTYGNLESLAYNLFYAIEHKSEAQKIANKGQQYAFTTYSAEENAKQIWKMYCNL